MWRNLGGEVIELRRQYNRLVWLSLIEIQRLSDVPRVLGKIGAGDPRSAQDLVPLVYEELRKLAAAKMVQEKPDQTPGGCRCCWLRRHAAGLHRYSHLPIRITGRATIHRLLTLRCGPGERGEVEGTVKRTLPIQELSYGALRVWAVFSVSSFLVSAVFSFWLGSNPLRSDEPYVPGFISGASTVMASLCWSGARRVDWGPWRRHCAYFVPLILLVVSLITLDVVDAAGEAQGIPTILAYAVAVGGLAGYPIQILKNGSVWIFAASVLGVLLLLGYASALTHVVW